MPSGLFFSHMENRTRIGNNAVHLQNQKIAIFSRNKKVWQERGHSHCPCEEFQGVHLQVDRLLKEPLMSDIVAMQRSMFVKTESAFWCYLIVVMTGDVRYEKVPLSRGNKKGPSGRADVFRNFLRCPSYAWASAAPPKRQAFSEGAVRACDRHITVCSF